ncbi:MAG: DMT family transporter [Candidatus Dormibacteraeota bacterium]|nr:DMT family transporter [Candidatus Dormibacteraeota bacterium]MDQ6900456.1 DMT family transporter [Candidatus Dormibacteraeota bacterium]
MGRLIDRYSVVAIAIAATLWATDSYFRNALVGHLSAPQVVFVEAGVVAVILLPALVRGWAEVLRLSTRGWLATILIAVGPQALATVLFTASFAYRNFAETYVLQQTQPLIAVLLAGVILGERRRPAFWGALALSMVAVYMVVFAPDPSAPLSVVKSGRVEAGALALGAAALWASGTVLGRYVLGSISFPTMTSLRVTLALPVLAGIVLATSGPAGFTHYRVSDVPAFLGLAVLTGVLALLLYYRALSRTPATLSSVAELAFPITATLIASAPAPIGFAQPIFPAQVVGTVLLLAVIVIVNANRREVMVAVPQPIEAPAPA